MKALGCVVLAVGLSSCTFSLQIGPEGRYVNQASELKPGVCIAGHVADYVKIGAGNCTEAGASTETLEHPGDEELPPQL